jgi:hypothetical protein
MWNCKKAGKEVFRAYASPALEAELLFKIGARAPLECDRSLRCSSATLVRSRALGHKNPALIFLLQFWLITSRAEA